MRNSGNTTPAAPKANSRNFSQAWPKTPGRLVGTGLIRLYQLSLSGFVGGHCRHLPTCSEYGYEAIARYGLWAGGVMTLFRLIRCGPGGTHGFDPVPARLPARYSPFRPWRYWHLPPAAPAGPVKGKNRRQKNAKKRDFNRKA